MRRPRRGLVRPGVYGRGSICVRARCSRRCEGLPVCAHAVSQRIPFVVTCSTVRDHERTQKLLMSPSGWFGIKPNVVVNEKNRFAAEKLYLDHQPNQHFVRNMFVMLIWGGQLGDIVDSIANGGEKGKQTIKQIKAAYQAKGSPVEPETWSVDLVSMRKKGLV